MSLPSLDEGKLQTQFTRSEHQAVWQRLPISDDRRSVILGKIIADEKKQRLDTNQDEKNEATRSKATKTTPQENADQDQE